MLIRILYENIIHSELYQTIINQDGETIRKTSGKQI